MARHILIVDDEKPMVEELQGLLEEEGYQVSAAYDGKEACQVFDKIKPDLVLLDIKMPKQSGVEVNRYINQQEKKVPVIILTGSFEKKHAELALEEGAKTVLYKPFDPEKMLEAIREYLPT